MGIHFLTLPVGSLASLNSGCLFFSACVAYISPRIHLWSGWAAVVWAVNKGPCPWFIQASTPLSEQRLFLEFPRGEGGQESNLGAEHRGMQQCQPWSLCWVNWWWWLCQRGSCLLQKGVSKVTQQQIAEKTFILVHWFVAVARKHLVHVSETCEFWLLLSELNRFILQLMDKGHCPQHPYLCISVPACLVRLHCHSLSLCHYSCDLWPVTGWLSATGDEISLQCYPSLCLGYSGIPQRGVSHWCCVSSAAPGFRSAQHLYVGGGNRVLVVPWTSAGGRWMAEFS